MFRILAFAMLVSAMCLTAFQPSSGLANARNDSVKIALLIQGATIQESAGDGCHATETIGEPELQFGSQAFDLNDGNPVTAKDSPTGRFGCLFKFIAKLDGSTSYKVKVGDELVGTVTLDQLASLDFSLEISVGATPVTQSGDTWRFPAPPTPAPTPTKTPIPTALPTPILGAVEGSDTYRVGGSFVLFGTNRVDFYSDAGVCIGRGGYSDIGPGTQVVVKDETGSIVAVSELEPDPHAPEGSCQFVFYIEVPEAKFYSFAVSHRGELVFSKQALEDKGWVVVFSLG